MKGRVIEINPHRGMVAVQTDGDITVMELLGGYDVELEEVISARVGRNLIAPHAQCGIDIVGKIRLRPTFNPMTPCRS